MEGLVDGCDDIDGNKDGRIEGLEDGMGVDGEADGNEESVGARVGSVDGMDVVCADAVVGPVEGRIACSRVGSNKLGSSTGTTLSDILEDGDSVLRSSGLGVGGGVGMKDGLRVG